MQSLQAFKTISAFLYRLTYSISIISTSLLIFAMSVYVCSRRLLVHFTWHVTSIHVPLAKLIEEISALRLMMLDVPSPVIVGESVELTCSYELDGDQLYSVKWYKNSVEFFRYVPNDWPPGQFLPMAGIKVDLSKSGKYAVFLKHVDLNSGGLYRCEVSAEAPEFKTAELEREMKVYVLPTEGPRITGSQTQYKIGDTVNINCTSAKSKPAAALRWYINNDKAEEIFELQRPTAMYTDSLETSSLGLRFTVTEKHFRHGSMKLKCTATILRVYTMSNEALVHNDFAASPLQIGLNQGKSSN